MAKTLILFRHGKSDRDQPDLADHDRPLARRGIKAAKAMGRMLADVNQIPELAIASTAIRARNTLDRAIAAGGWTSRRQTDPALYESSAEAMLTFVRGLPESADSVLLAGHEPTWSELTSLLTAGGNLRFPTGAMVRIDFSTPTWRDIRAGAGSLAWFIPPRFITDRPGRL